MALEMRGEYTLLVHQTELWRLLNDPSVSGEYMGSVEIFEKQEPLHYVLMVQGQGSIGFMKGRAAFDLASQGETESLLRYAGSAEVGGVVAGVGQRVLSGVAKYLAGRFFKALEKHIDEGKKGAKDAQDATAA